MPDFIYLNGLQKRRHHFTASEKSTISRLCLLCVSTLISISAGAKDPALPNDYVVSPVPYSEGCVVVKTPAHIKGAQICVIKASPETAAEQLNVFEKVDGTWYLVGPGVPSEAKVSNRGDVSLLEGVTFCPLEDANGSHNAGGKCYYAMAYKDDIVFVYRSPSIPLNKARKSSFDAHRNSFMSIYSENLR